jgi:two-component system sensor histidine kinase TctE
MPANKTTLRNKLLRFLLIPLSLLFLIDASGSYFVATSLSDELYDRELVEIAQELSLHVGHRGGRLEFDLPGEIKRTLLTDPDDKIYFAIYGAGGERTDCRRACIVATGSPRLQK